MAKNKPLHLPTLPEIARSSPLSVAQLKEIEDLILKRGNFSRERTRRELAWFCRDLGIADYYFKYTPLRAIARHIEFFRAAQIIAESSGRRAGNIQFVDEQAETATYLGEDDYEQVRTIKQRIEEHFPVFRLHSYRSRGYPLRIYLVTRPVFRGAGEAKPSFDQSANLDFMKNSPPATIERYRSLWTELQGRHVPLVRFSELPDENETRVMVGLERDAAPGFLTNFTFILKKYQIHILREYAEPFADGTVIFSFYLNRVENRELPERLEHDINMAAIMPRGRLAELSYSGACSAPETMYAFAAAAFAHQFLTTYTEEYLTLSGELKGKPELQGLLTQFKTHLAKDTYHEDRINGAILKHRAILRLLYEAFVQKFVPSSKKRQPEIHLAKARERIAAEVTSEIERHILEALLTFNQAIQKTNFFKSEKICLSFRLDPSYLSPIDYPERPFGIFYIFGKGFRGFHIRFRDIARGGVRMVRSPSQADYDLNSDFIFDENYNLALTQQHKNKDIPEGGSKGTILLGREYQDKGEMIFKQYIDGLLDLLLPHPDIVDLLGREEIIFLGPDEGTAELMNWAALRARERGYRYWKAFTTGKKPELGGIPHDTYGMTTNGVREFVKGIQEELGWKEEEVTKFQTGGPDGDLGSNEILFSREKMLAVVDGSGVLYDPKGIDREELERLARKRRTIADFDRKKLSPEG
ncbi:MAG: NAD-glutamate dehydrogenase, partial [Candidatus Aureabacteria bacterium]|nr:NAD-glutamate dehydrogenase [Candidatus Auribacterota bacterium]